MIKGILALFRSGLIFNPVVLCGIIFGIIGMTALEDEQFTAYYSNPCLYVLMLMISVVYVYSFKCVYVLGKNQIDWKETSLSMFGHFLIMVVSFISSMLFISMVGSFFSPRIKSQKNKNEAAVVVNIEETEMFTNNFAPIENDLETLQKEYDEIMKSYTIPQ